MFLTIAIQTYNRANKLENLLNQFIQLGSEYIKNIEELKLEILISDNCSNDNTEAIVGKAIPNLEKIGFHVTFFRQPQNLGMDGNSLFVFTRALGDYVWFFSDDDILIPENTKLLLEDLIHYNPSVCLSNFIQPPYSFQKSIFLENSNKSTKIIKDPIECINSIKKYPKLSNYVIKRGIFNEDYIKENYSEIITSCLGKYYFFIALTLLSYFTYGSILLRKSSIAKCDGDYLNIEYSPRVFENLNLTVRQTLESIGQYQYIKPTTSLPSTIKRVNASIKFLSLFYSSKIFLSEDIVKEEEHYLSNISFYYLIHPFNFFYFLKMNLLKHLI